MHDTEQLCGWVGVSGLSRREIIIDEKGMHCLQNNEGFELCNVGTPFCAHPTAPTYIVTLTFHDYLKTFIL